MNNFEHYLRQVNEKSFKDFPYQLYHSKDNMRTAKGFNSKEAALKYAMDEKIDQFDIFRNGSGFHSTTQDEFLVLWADKNGDGYFSNRSKKEPELLKKKFEINEKQNESGEMVPVQAGEIIKLQKPAQDSYTNNTINTDGLEIADCTVCGATGVVVGQHICKTVVDPTDQVPSEYNMVENVEMDEHITDVLFLVEKDGEDEDVFAYFPNEKSDEAGKFRTAYSHVGQHSGCDPKYAEECREAMPIHYKPLQQELTQLGYNLNVLNAPTTVSERFDSIRSKYGIRESKMITKLELFKYIAESPMNDTPGDDMKHTKSGLSMTPEQAATEAERLFGRYNTADTIEEVSEMFPDYKTSELEDAVNHILDTIYDAENMQDYVWNAVKSLLVEKFNALLTSQ